MLLKLLNIKAELKTRIKGEVKTYNFIDNITDWSVTIGEQERSSSSTLSIYDSKHEIFNELAEKLETDGGFFVPINFFGEEETATPGDDTGGTTDLNNIKDGLLGDELATVIVSYAKSVGITQTEQIAYILASADHESKMGVYTSEIGGENARYAPYYGRGLVQLTWENNYAKWGKFLGQDFVNNPDLVSKLQYAIPILVLGMSGKNGAPNFTGVVLDDYITPGKVDYIGARRIVNGTDRSQDIADIAKKYEQRLRNGELQSSTVTAPTTVDLLSNVNLNLTNLASVQQIGQQIVNQTVNNANQQQFIEELNTATDTATEYSTITISLFYTSSNTVEYTYVWTGLEIKNNNTIISGQSVDAIIAANSAAKEIRSYQNTSLRQFANDVAKENGLQLKLTETELSEKIISTISQYEGETKYETLGRIAKASGYFLRNDGSALILEPLIAEGTSLTLEKSNFLSTPNFSEKADSARVTGKGLPPIVKGLTRIKDLENTGGTGSVSTAVNASPEDAILRVYVTGNDDATGFIIDSKGTFVTNAHVAGSSIGYAITKKTEKLETKFIYTDNVSDIAIGTLPARSDPYPYLTLATSANLQIGDEVIAIGMPETKSPWYKTKAKVTSINSISNVDSATVSTEAGLLEPGSSGSPIFNSSGEVVGMAQAIKSSDRTGRIIPIELLQTVISAASPTLTPGTNTNTIISAIGGLGDVVDIAQALKQSVSNTGGNGDETYVSNVQSGYQVGKGFNLNFEYFTTEDLLSLKTGTVITVPTFGYASKTGGEYRLGEITHRKGSVSSLGLYKPVWIKETSRINNTKEPGTTIQTTAKKAALMEVIRSMIGQRFKPDVSAQCAVFVRTMLEKVGIKLGVTTNPVDGYLPTSEAFANSMAGSDIGTVITDLNSVQDLDLLFWANTYGNYPTGTITHIGFCSNAAEKLTIDRSTSEKPISERPISTFADFTCAVRLSQLTD